MLARTSIVILLLTLAYQPHNCDAALVTYSVRSTWESAMASFQTETFNGFTVNTDLSAAPVATLFGTMKSDVGPFNLIDVSPFQVPHVINGTPYYRGRINGGTNETRLEFTTPISGFGAEFSGVMGGTGGRMELLDATDTLIGSVFLPGSSSGTGVFGGFTFDAGEQVHAIEFKRTPANDDNFSGDDFSFRQAGSSALIPEPSSFVLMSIAGIILLASRYRRCDRAELQQSG